MTDSSRASQPRGKGASRGAYAQRDVFNLCDHVSLEGLAKALGGKVEDGEVRCHLFDHKSGAPEFTIRLDRSAPDGFVVPGTSFNGKYDWKAVKAEVISILGLEREYQARSRVGSCTWSASRASCA